MVVMTPCDRGAAPQFAEVPVRLAMLVLREGRTWNLSHIKKDWTAEVPVCFFAI